MTCSANCPGQCGCGCSGSAGSASLQGNQELREGMSTGTKVVLWLLLFFVGIPTLIGLFVFIRHRRRMSKAKGWFKGLFKGNKGASAAPASAYGRQSY